MERKIFAALVLGVVFVSPQLVLASTAATVSSPFLYNFNSPGKLVEAGDQAGSTSRYWWLNSGGYMNLEESGKGSTVQGKLPVTDPWRVLYAASSPTDTDGGYHPQNLFRLVTRAKWQNARQEAYFQIKANNLSTSGQRYESNGLLLFNRYQDGNNLYYTGVRVDGSVIIKKKIAGKYFTMKQVYGIYPGTYNHDTNPNVLPSNTWIGVRSEVVNQANGAVKIDVYIDKGWSGKWVLAASVVDDGVSYGGKALTAAGYGGIRTDFMDVEFENFKFTSL